MDGASAPEAAAAGDGEARAHGATVQGFSTDGCSSHPFRTNGRSSAGAREKPAAASVVGWKMRDGPEPSRREILWTGSVAVGLLAPAWVRSAFAQDRAGDADAPAALEGAPVAPVPEVFAAFRRARRLVLFVRP